MKFSIFGIDVEITFLFSALIAFIISLNAPANVLITIFSSLLHELGHLLIMSAVGNKPQKVRFEITGMNIFRQQNIKISIKNEILIALGGPLMNLFCLIISSIFLCVYNSEITMTFACVNLILMIFNLLPINKFDGGLALYFLLSQKFDNEISIKTLKVTSILSLSLIYVWGIYSFFASGYNFSLIIIAIFLTLSTLSGNEY